MNKNLKHTVLTLFPSAVCNLNCTYCNISKNKALIEIDKELEDYMWGLYSDISDNMEYILSLVQFYIDKGGLTPGTYKCKTSDKIWAKE